MARLAFLPCAAAALRPRARLRCRHPPPRRRRPRPRPCRAALIAPSDTYAVVAALAACAAAGQAAAARTRAGRALSAPVVAMLAAAALANAGVLPAAPRALPLLQAAATRVATPLLLLGADLRVVVRDTRRLTAAFGVATAATVLGALLAWACIARAAATPDGAWQLAAAIAAKNVGGGINFMAVLDTYGADASRRWVGLGLSADNILGLLYFPLNSYLCDRMVRRSGRVNRSAPAPAGPASPASPAPAASGAADSVPKMTSALAASLAIVAVSQHLVPAAPVPAAAAVTVAVATLAPSVFAPLAHAGATLGTLTLYALFACAGASGASFGSLFGAANRRTSLTFVLFCGVLYATHVLLILAAHKLFTALFSPSRDEASEAAKLLLLGSNAAIGGPATAAALADAKGYDTAVVSAATIVGTFGNAIGSFAGLAVGKVICALLP